MRFAGIDIGSRTIELVVVNEEGKIVESLQSDTNFDPMAEANKLLAGVQYDCIMATGYGRTLFELAFASPTVTEIKAHATGARVFFPDALTILEVMARTLGYAIDAFGEEALLAEQDVNISSMCTVFAESEVTSLIAKGTNPREIALGLHASVIRRAAGMINRVSSAGDIVFTGGVAKNPCMISLLAKRLGRRVFVPDDPQCIGAFGAALLAREA